jgi:hypothetical protein
VTLFAAPGSHSAAHVRSPLEQAHPDRIGSALYEADYVAAVYDMIDRSAMDGEPFDVVHDHSGFTALAMAHRITAPVVHTLHGPFDENTRPFYERHGHKARRLNRVTNRRGMGPTLYSYEYSDAAEPELFAAILDVSERRIGEVVETVGLAAHADALHLRRAARHLPGDRGADVRPVPVQHHVPRHLDRDAARAHEWHPGTADEPAARPVRQRVCAHRVPGRAVHARDHLPAAVAVRLFVERHEMAGALYGLSDALPLTYAYDALARATHPGPLGSRVALDVAVILGATLIALALGALTLRRRTA